MERQRDRKSWRDIDRTRDRSQQRREGSEADRKREETARSNATAKQHRNALEALFTPKKEPSPEEEALAAKAAPRIVLAPNPDADPRNAERRKLLARLAAAAGPLAISKAADEFLAAGFVLPDDQEIHLQMLEHTNETIVVDAITALARILAGQLPKRKPVLDQRLRRIEEHAEDCATRDAASALRRLIHGRITGPAPAAAR